MLLRIALAAEKIFGCRSNYKNSLLQFFAAEKAAKILSTHADRAYGIINQTVLQTWWLKLASMLSKFKNK